MSSATAPSPRGTPSTTARIKRLMPYFKNSWKSLVAVIVATLIGSATEPAIPALMQQLLDKGFQAGALPLWWVPLALLGLFSLRGAASFVAQYCLSNAANHAMQLLRRHLFAKVLQADLSLFARHNASSISNTVVYEVQNGTHMLVYAMLSVLKDSLTFVALLGYLLYINWKLTLFVLVILPAVAWVMKVLSKRLHQITRASQTATDHLAYVVEENVLAHRTVRLHAAQDQQGERFNHHNQALRRLAMKATIAASAMTPLTQMVAAVALSGVICTALWQSATNGISVGTFASFITAMLMLVAPIKHLSESASPITRGLAALERGLDLIEGTPTEHSGQHQQATTTGHFTLRHVSVRYPNQTTDTLSDISLDITPSQTLAIVGTSGAGKTTLVNLFARFTVPSAGVVALDGVDLNDWEINGLRRHLAFVSQDLAMFNESIAYNVALGSNPDRQRVIQALQAANLGTYLDSLPLGIDTVVGHNATQLSGGQRQRLAIARAIYKDAAVLILDEATSALDTESERAVQEALERLKQGRTTIIIAHRLSTIEHADRIVVMQSGRIAETGTHATLIAQGGLYARLHNTAQAQGSDAITELEPAPADAPSPLEPSGP